MKRFHVHVSVDDLAANVRFYSRLFGAEPAVVKADYAKWMVEDPRINFAISSRGRTAGVNHLGVQVDSDSELTALRAQFADAGLAGMDQDGASCCYAKSDKTWLVDPQGVPWETYHTMGVIETFGEDAASKGEAAGARSACCGPSAKSGGATGRAMGCRG